MSTVWKVLAWTLVPLIIWIILSYIHLKGRKSADPEAIKTEFKRWKDWANTLIVVMTVLLAFDGSLLGNVEVYNNWIGFLKWIVLLSGVIGVMGIFLVVIWYPGEGFWQGKNMFICRLKIPFFDGKPVLLLLASSLFGAQTVTFLLSFVIRQIAAKS